MKKILFFAAALGVWQIISALVVENSLLFPSLLDVCKKIINDGDRIFFHSMVTYKEMLMGMLFGILLSFLLCFSMIKFTFAKSVVDPFFLIMKCVPMFILAPLLLLWVGMGKLAIIIPTTLMVSFPMTVNLYKGIQAAPISMIHLFERLGGTKWQIFIKLQLPYSLPYFFSGLKVSSTIAGVAAIGSEFAGAQSGLGIYIQECRVNFDLPGVFGAIFFQIILTLSLLICCHVLERLARAKKYC